jgi:hypothetical protein
MIHHESLFGSEKGSKECEQLSQPFKKTVSVNIKPVAKVGYSLVFVVIPRHPGAWSPIDLYPGFHLMSESEGSRSVRSPTEDVDNLVALILCVLSPT